MRNKTIWKNIDWISKEEKREFFNRYFNGKNREFVIEEIQKYSKIKKEAILDYLLSDIKEKDKPIRQPNTKDIKKFIEEIL